MTRLVHQKRSQLIKHASWREHPTVDINMDMYVRAAQVSVVTRLVHQKGIHLIKHAAWRTLERGGQFVLLGSAPDPRVQVSL
jgi:glycogen synthase